MKFLIFRISTTRTLPSSWVAIRVWWISPCWYMKPSPWGPFRHKNVQSLIPEMSVPILPSESATSHSIINGNWNPLAYFLMTNVWPKYIYDLGASELHIGYLDPECLQIRHLTEKVMSLTSGWSSMSLSLGTQQLIQMDLKKRKVLLQRISFSMMEHALADTMDNQLVEEEAMKPLKEISELAVRCLNL